MRILGVCAPAAGRMGSGAPTRMAAVDRTDARSAPAAPVGASARAA
jgi:hypothetical protein